MALSFSACGDSNGSDAGGNGGADGAAEKPDPALAGVCDAKDDLAKAIEDLQDVDIDAPGGSGFIVGELDKVRAAFEEVNAEYKKLEPDARAQWETAESDFRVEFVGSGLDLADAVRESDPATAIKKVTDKVEADFENAYGDIDCG